MAINEVTISEKWIKASIVGTIWAAAEIVLGSFLHNLRIPFSGNILTGIGLVILISVSYIWKEKGLFWRAGLICAIMKTMSPSAVIFGPMIAIFSESVLLEISVRLLGRTVPGYLIGSMLAMSWNLFQKTINLIIFYGNNIIDLYSSLVRYAEKQIKVHFDIFWLPLLILLVLYCIFGIVVAVIGIRTGHKLLRQPPGLSESSGEAPYVSKPDSGSRFNYSLLWLAADILLIISLLVMVSRASWAFWVPAVTMVVALWSVRYVRAMRQLSKPGLWIFFVLITMFSVLIFTRLQADPMSLSDALLTGIQMNFRAVIIITGFAVLGTELYNPVIRNFFLRKGFSQLPLAIELSAESLPSMLAGIPDLKTIIRNPVSILYRMIARVELRLNEIKRDKRPPGKIFILTGNVGAGKTTFVIDLLRSLSDAGVSAGGIYSPRVFEEDGTVGYDIADIRNNIRIPFLRQKEVENSDKVGKFTILTKGLETGLEALKPTNNRDKRIVIIDEAGPLELSDKGWAGRISELLAGDYYCILIIVRPALIDKVIAKWNIRERNIVSVPDPLKKNELLEYLLPD